MKWIFLIPLCAALSACGWSEYHGHVKQNIRSCDGITPYKDRIACHRDVYVQADTVGNHPASFVHRLGVFEMYQLAEYADEHGWSEQKFTMNLEPIFAAVHQSEIEIRRELVRGVQVDMFAAQRMFTNFLFLEAQIDGDVAYYSGRRWYY